jgi:hypothetical protein
MQHITVTLQGTSPLLMHRFNEQAEAKSQAGTRKIKLAEDAATPRETAMLAAYMDEKGRLYTPSTWVMGSLINTGSEHKLTGSRKSLRFLLPSAVRVAKDRADLLDPDTKKPIVDFEVDARPVVIPATKGRVMRYRPRIERWNLVCDFFVDTEMIAVSKVVELLNEAGRKYGIGDFRPEKRGPFGCFVVTNVKEH